MEVKPARLIAVAAYRPTRPNQLAFATGDMLDLLETHGLWYKARDSTGSVGLVPSNDVRLCRDGGGAYSEAASYAKRAVERPDLVPGSLVPLTGLGETRI